MSRTLYPAPLSGSPELVTLKFRFQVGATGGAEPDFIVPASCGVHGVTRDGSAGLYTITFSEKYPVFIGCLGHVMEATPAHDLIVKADVADYDAALGTLIITVVGVDGSTAAEDVIENDWVYMEVTFCKRSELAPSGAIPLTNI
jgi:hypothetical protein